MKEPFFINEINEKNQLFFQHSMTLDKDYEILNENDQCSHVLFLVKGKIEVYKLSENGKVFRLYTIDEGESCVLNLSCILSDNAYHAYARTMTEVECIMIPRHQFLEIFKEEEALRSYVFDLIATRLIQITAKVEGIVLDSIESRLKDWLMKQPSSMVYITHEELANHLGSVREVVSRQLKKCERDGQVKLYRGKIEILKAL